MIAPQATLDRSSSAQSNAWMTGRAHIVDLAERVEFDGRLG